MNFFFESMKFLFSVIAAYVGIRAVVNSSKSAKLSAESVRIASESINLNKEKEQREQSAHLIPVSPSGEFAVSIPNIRDDDKRIDFSDTNLTKDYILSKIDSQTKNRYRYRDLSDVFVKIINVGKGSSVNLEWSFKIKNLHEMDNYFYTNQVNNAQSLYGSQYRYTAKYIKSVDSETELLIVKICDLSMEEALKREKEMKEEISSLTHSEIFIEGTPLIRYVDVIKGESDHTIPLPSSFIVLCRQYLMANDSIINEELLEDDTYSRNNSIPVKPIGEIILSYYDESLIRSKETAPDKKNILKYEITIKDVQENSHSLELPYYLEISFSNL